jgi:hypothetical protein
MAISFLLFSSRRRERIVPRSGAAVLATGPKIGHRWWPCGYGEAMGELPAFAAATGTVLVALGIRLAAADR